MKLLLTLLFPLMLFSQAMPHDTIYGKVKSVREKMVFIDSLRQTYKLWSEEGDYGHHGFMNRKAALSRNYDFWYTLPFVHYVNYDRVYDTLGRITKETWYYKNNEIVTSYQFRYNKNNNLVEQKETDSEGELDQIKRWGFDYSNKHISTVNIYFGSYIAHWFEGYTYDSIGNLTEKVRFSDDERQSTTTHEYQNGKKVRTYILAPASTNSQLYRTRKPALRFEYQYDEKGNVTELKDHSKAVFEKEGSPPYIRKWRYDANNNLLENTQQDYARKYKYNSKNQLTEEVFISGEKVLNTRKFFYKDERLSKLIFEEDGNKYNVTFDYKLDSKSNWIEQSKSVNGKKLYVRRREIKYWE